MGGHQGWPEEVASGTVAPFSSAKNSGERLQCGYKGVW